jgi:carboxymethylenebutenolidase
MSAQDNVKLWDEHLKGEFITKNENESLATMVEDASVLAIPTGWGGKGKTQLRSRYRDEFIPSISAGWEHTLINRVATENCVVEEAMMRFRHIKQMDWFLPGVPPTGKPIEIEFVIVVEFRDGKMSAERIYWDQAAVLRQVGLLEQGPNTRRLRDRRGPRG